RIEDSTKDELTRGVGNDVSDCREKKNSVSAFSAFSAFDLLNIFFIV
ncbi:unnamed protein product, partial [Callosobruchus maculatus]